MAAAQAVVGQPAPAFTATDSNGKPESLADFKGKWVVLEWINNDCPFVKKHYGSGNMQKLQKAYTGKGVIWLSVISSAPGKEGSVDGAKANSLTQERGASPTAVLLDPQGTLGRALRGQDDAAHVRDRPPGPPRLQRGHRRQALHGHGGHRRSEELRRRPRSTRRWRASR